MTSSGRDFRLLFWLSLMLSHRQTHAAEQVQAFSIRILDIVCRQIRGETGTCQNFSGIFYCRMRSQCKEMAVVDMAWEKEMNAKGATKKETASTSSRQLTKESINLSTTGVPAKGDLQAKRNSRCTFPSGLHVTNGAFVFFARTGKMIHAFDIKQNTVSNTGLVHHIRTSVKFLVTECKMYTLKYRVSLTSMYLNGIGGKLLQRGMIRAFSIDPTTKLLITLWFGDGMSFIKMSTLDGAGIRTVYNTQNMISSVHAGNGHALWKAKLPGNRYAWYTFAYDTKQFETNDMPSFVNWTTKVVRECFTSNARLFWIDKRGMIIIEVASSQKKHFAVADKCRFATCFRHGAYFGVLCFVNGKKVIQLYSWNGTVIPSFPPKRTGFVLLSF